MLTLKWPRAIRACLIVSFVLGYGLSANAGPGLGVWDSNLEMSKEDCAKRAKAVMASERLKVIWSSNANDAFIGDNKSVRVFVRCHERGSKSWATIAAAGKDFQYYADTVRGGMTGGPLD